ncbi:dephospho-CoA kinase [Salipaludibacillus keqinensis]|uniref:Dephospho-CoA kinase n=1 Tax=Salipaludibacillus keqinensis TaxID=2045207 RepID=A0A323TW05_9BACI|nr:dephospho-CoA kinase [Salipaludibacillus keqinensis]PYZ93725.1 dephospho-CoA kinase [Salipaludibacillus keqinensis]
MIIGLTGGIASGKSTVSTMLKNEGIPVVDADIVAREVVEPGRSPYLKIVDHFGSTILHEDRTINREKLGKIVFESEKERTVLNQIVHPAVREEMRLQAAEWQKKGHQLIVMDIPLLIESELLHMVDEVLLVYVSPRIQLDRLRTRNNFSIEEANQRIDSQLPIDEKKKFASYVINNEGTLEETRNQVIHLLNEWKKEC